MSSYKVSIPNDLSLSGLSGLSFRLEALPEVDNYLFDFEKVKWMEPFPMLYLAHRLKYFRITHPEVGCGVTNYKHLTYASHMGFFKAFGVDHGRDVGEALGGKSYLPITELDPIQIRKDNLRSYDPLGKQIDEHAMELSKALLQQNYGDHVELTKYCLREALRNVVEHSRAERLMFCAQHWQRSGVSEIVIFDNGLGVKKTLSNNPYLDIHTDEDALRYCLRPGISGVMFKGVDSDPHDYWENSGFGLYVLTELARRCSGALVLSSGQRALRITSTNKTYFSLFTGGTAIRLRINLKKFAGVATGSLIRDIVQEGERIAGFEHDSFHKASKASSSL